MASGSLDCNGGCAGAVVLNSCDAQMAGGSAKMRNQLRAAFRRLIRSRLFWGLACGMTGIGFWMLAGTSEVGEPIAASSVYMGPAVIWVAVFIFVAGFEGDEFYDGAMRNKLVTGASRTSVYYALLLISVAAALVLLGAFLLPFCTVGAWMGIVDVSPEQLPAFFHMLALSILCSVASVCVYHLVAMISPSKMPIVLFAVSVGLFVAGFALVNGLREPQYVEEWWDEAGQVTGGVPNPYYVAEPARSLGKALLQLIPAGDAIALTIKERTMQAVGSAQVTIVTNMRGLVDYPFMPAYLAVTSIATCTIGNAVFRRRNLT